MMTNNRISIAVSVILTFILVRELLRFATGDFFTSIIPGWHTTLYSTEWMLSIGAIIILSICFVAFLLFKLLNKLVLKLLNR